MLFRSNMASMRMYLRVFFQMRIPSMNLQQILLCFTPFHLHRYGIMPIFISCWYGDMYCLDSYQRQPGLAGIELGTFLIKRVVQLLQQDMPQVEVTLGATKLKEFTVEIGCSRFFSLDSYLSRRLL